MAHFYENIFLHHYMDVTEKVPAMAFFVYNQVLILPAASDS